jgi:tetratricopeptide (TPR) repeat protein
MTSLADGPSDLAAGKEANSKGDYTRSIELFTAALGEGLSADNQMMAFFGRANAYQSKGDYDRAIRDYDELVRLNPRYASVYVNRGLAYYNKGDYERVIADSTEAIRLDPGKMKAYNNRGNAYFNRGEYDQAISDYTDAMRLDLEDRDVLTNRARTYFVVGAFPQSADDFDRALAMRSNDADDALWRFMARQRAGQEGRKELNEWSEAVKEKAWPDPVVRYFLGKATRDQVFVAAKAGVATPLVNPQCAASVYVGEYDLLHGHVESARSLFEAAVKTCPPTFSEYHLAMAELTRGVKSPSK